MHFALQAQCKVSSSSKSRRIASFWTCAHPFSMKSRRSASFQIGRQTDRQTDRYIDR